MSKQCPKTAKKTPSNVTSKRRIPTYCQNEVLDQLTQHTRIKHTFVNMSTHTITVYQNLVCKQLDVILSIKSLNNLLYFTDNVEQNKYWKLFFSYLGSNKKKYRFMQSSLNGIQSLRFLIKNQNMTFKLDIYEAQLEIQDVNTSQ